MSSQHAAAPMIPPNLSEKDIEFQMFWVLPQLECYRHILQTLQRQSIALSRLELRLDASVERGAKQYSSLARLQDSEEKMTSADIAKSILAEVSFFTGRIEQLEAKIEDECGTMAFCGHEMEIRQSLPSIAEPFSLNHILADFDFEKHYLVPEYKKIQTDIRVGLEEQSETQLAKTLWDPLPENLRGLIESPGLKYREFRKNYRRALTGSDFSAALIKEMQVLQQTSRSERAALNAKKALL